MFKNKIENSPRYPHAFLNLNHLIFYYHHCLQVEDTAMGTTMALSMLKPLHVELRGGFIQSENYRTDLWLRFTDILPGKQEVQDSIAGSGYNFPV